jgi:hypothetical protein
MAYRDALTNLKYPEGTQPVILEVSLNSTVGDVTFNIIFTEAGEIRQKQVTREWLMKRVFMSELKTWAKNRGEYLLCIFDEPEPVEQNG